MPGTLHDIRQCLTRRVPRDADIGVRRASWTLREKVRLVAVDRGRPDVCVR